MAKLEYHSEEPLNREAKHISFDVPDDMNIHEYKIMCVRLASAIGYHSSSICKAFGELDYETESDIEFKDFLKSLNIIPSSGSLIG
jgi:hypothetical protein